VSSLFLECKAEGSAGIVSGYCSTFGNVDAYGDIIQAGAFTDSLKEHQAQKTRPALLWSHQQDSPIGKIVDIEQDGYGLHVRSKLTLSVPLARNAFALAADDCLAFSIGFGVVEKSQQGNSRIIEQAHLAEVSLAFSFCTLPGFPVIKQFRWNVL
jgi:HK97 family phage prohead protease